MSCSFCLCWREWNRILHLARQKGSTYQLQETPNKLNWEKQATARNTLVLSYIFKNDFQVILPLRLTHWTNIKALMESEILYLPSRLVSINTLHLFSSLRYTMKVRKWWEVWEEKRNGHCKWCRMYTENTSETTVDAKREERQ